MDGGEDASGDMSVAGGGGDASGDMSIADGGEDSEVAQTDASPGEAGSAPAPDPNSAVSFLINPAHTSSVSGSTLRPPLTPLWTTALPGIDASYPLIANGVVYVTSAAASAAATVLALDAQTGVTLWSSPLPSSFAAAAYDGGRLFVVDGTGGVTAFDAVSGQIEWTQSMAGNNTFSFSTVPTAYRGILYTSAGGDEGGTIFAFDEATGRGIFQMVNPSSDDESPPAVADDGFVVAYACQQTYKEQRLTGVLEWHYSTSCSGGGGDIPVLQGDRVYITDLMGNLVLDGSNGSAVGTFTAGMTPSFDDKSGLFEFDAQLVAVDLASGLIDWTYASMPGDYFLSPALLAGGYVYTVDWNGSLRAFDEQSGTPVWSVASTFAESGIGLAPAALAASGDLLVVPEGTKLVAYTSAGDGGAAPDADSDSGGGCTWTMEPGPQPAVGNTPVSVAIGDVNGDGKSDLAVANFDNSVDEVPWAPGTVSVLLGNGDGTFQAQTTYPTGAGTVSVAIGDFTGDGRADLAVIGSGTQPDSTSPSTVTILIGNGDGTFQPGLAYPTGPDSTAIAIGDLNADGKADLVVANDAPTPINVLLGNGDGTFQPAVSYETETGGVGVSVALGDLNGDGAPDLVVADEIASVDVLLNNGDGTFKSAVAYASAPNCTPFSVAVADLNADGKLDVAAADLGTNNVNVFLGNGDGTLQAPVGFPTNRRPTTLRIADMNGDHNLDLVVDDDGSPDVSVLFGDGHGSFQPQVFFAFNIAFDIASNNTAIAVGDLNGDGQPDLVGALANDTVGILMGGCRP